MPVTIKYDKHVFILISCRQYAKVEKSNLFSRKREETKFLVHFLSALVRVLRMEAYQFIMDSVFYVIYYDYVMEL